MPWSWSCTATGNEYLWFIYKKYFTENRKKSIDAWKDAMKCKRTPTSCVVLDLRNKNQESHWVIRVNVRANQQPFVSEVVSLISLQSFQKVRRIKTFTIKNVLSKAKSVASSDSVLETWVGTFFLSRHSHTLFSI